MSVAEEPETTASSTSSDQAPSSTTSHHRKEFVRRKNYEQQHPFILNFFWIFYFPYVCRTAPVTEEDVPYIAKRDEAEGNAAKLHAVWDPRYAEYVKQLAVYEQNKKEHPDQHFDKPAIPSLVRAILRAFIDKEVIWALVCLALASGFLCLEPIMCKYIMDDSIDKAYHDTLLEYVEQGRTDWIPAEYLPMIEQLMQLPGGAERVKQMAIKMIEDTYSDAFPIAYTIILMLSPILYGLFEGHGNRIFFHLGGSLRAALCRMVFDKTLLLNMMAQSGMDSGRLLTLISSDARHISELMPLYLIFAMIPVQFIVPLIILLVRLGPSPLMSFAVLLVIMPIVYFFLQLVDRGIREFLRINDDRTKLTNETFEGIRVVKFTGLEDFFISRMVKSRSEQIIQTGQVEFNVQVITVFARNLPNLVNFSVMIVYVFSKDADQQTFLQEMVVRQAYLALMTISATVLPIVLQAAMMIHVSFVRINEYLVLTEMKKIVRDEPSSSSSDASDVVYRIKDGVFEWETSFKIPKSIGERQAVKNRRRELKKELARKHDKAFRNGKTIDDIIEEEEEKKAGPSKKFRMEGINVELRKGTLTMVIGNVGCGKSSLASTVVGDINQLGGTIEQAKMSIAYCPQQAWIVNGTVRENITLSDEGTTADNQAKHLSAEELEAKYQHTVDICCLAPDFKILAAGDMTSIGEKGVNLSGGQKARIQLARAVYSDKDFYILDDPLSAVDAHVGRTLFEECIYKELRGRGKTVLLTTNQLQFLDKADNVIVLHDGRILDQGTSEQLKSRGIDFTKFLVTSTEDAPAEEKKEDKEEEKKESSQEQTEGAEKAVTPSGTPDSSAEESKKEAEEIMTEEEQMTGSIPWRTYWNYFQILLPSWRLPLFIVVFLVGIFGTVFFQYWQGVVGTTQWSSSFAYHTKLYWMLYITLWTMFILFLQAVMGIGMERRAGFVIHDKLVHSVMNCPSSFFDTTPLGRVINRFTGDLTQQDMLLLTCTLTVLTLWVTMVGEIIIVAVDTPVLWIVGAAALVAFWLVVKLYIRTARNFQRLESMARSPVLSVFSECLNGAGLTTIRAYGLQQRWINKFNRLNDDWTARFIIFREGAKWATTYSGIISCLLLLSMVLVGWYKMEPAKVMVAITAAIIFGVFGTQIVQQQIEMEGRLTAHQRVMFYADSLPQETSCLAEVPKDKSNIQIVDSRNGNTPLTQEEIDNLETSGAQLYCKIKVDDATREQLPPKTWPETGEVEFDDVSFRYRPRLPFVLKHVSFKFRSGEKIGICGRTGAGKSSLIFPLFRLVELDPRLNAQRVDPQTGFLEMVPCDPTVYDDHNTNRGRILIDGVDIATVPISRLRRSLAIIPQDPTLFTGTLRRNLDLAGICTDDEIWEVLELVSLKDMMDALPQGLDTQVTEGGRNFSCGQRQLICFARAMLQRTSIVLMDEATANVDVETDAKIQNTIRNVFREQTVIVVAHRLNTIIGSDRILVMDHGEIAELDTPANLMANPNSHFNGLVRSLSGDQ